VRDPIAFLDAVAGYTLEAGAGGSADRPIRLGTIDPAYVFTSYPATLPKVTFDGESTLSGKRYVVLTPGYLPRASDRVVLLPVGNTYVIIGSVDQDAAAYHGGGALYPANMVWDDQADGNDTFTSTSYNNVSNFGTQFVAGISGAVEVAFGATIATNGTALGGTSWSAMSFEIRTGSTLGGGSVVLAAADTHRAVVYTHTTATGFKYTAAARTKSADGLTPGDTYHARAMWKVGTGTGAYLNRWIQVKQLNGTVT
jgi:hypothetical protein